MYWHADDTWTLPSLGDSLIQRQRRIGEALCLAKLRVEVSQAERSVEVEFEAKAELLLNPMKQVQGGYLCAMLDECMSVACMVASGMTAVAPTLEMKTTFFRPGMPGKIKGVGKVVKWGRQVAFTEGELFDAEGRTLARATGTAIPTPFANYKK